MIEETRQEYPEFRPVLAVVQVGNREDSNVYIRQKRLAAEEIGLGTQLIQLSTSTNERQV